MSGSRLLVLGISTAGSAEVALSNDGTDIVRAGAAGALELVAAFVDEAVAAANATLNDVALIGVCTGTGSFTGLRIGVAFAKTLAQTLGVPIAGISTYDVVTFGNAVYPVIAVARGKKDHYYARVTASEDGDPRFVQGSHAEIERAASEFNVSNGKAVILGQDFSTVRPGDAARAVVALARQAHARAEALDWPNITVDYGQRPNAVLNWERRLAGREGRPVSRREPSGE